MVTVVEQPTIPQLMTTAATFMEVLVICSIKFVQSVQHVLGGVTVDDVKKHDDAHAMSSIDQLLQVLGWSISATRSKEVVDLVTKAGIVRMLHDRHELNDVIPKALDSRQHVVGKLFVGRNSQLRRGNSNMCFVDASALRLLRPRVFELVLFGCGWVPEASFVRGGYGQVLRHVFDPCGKTVDALAARELQGNLVANELMRDPAQ